MLYRLDDIKKPATHKNKAIGPIFDGSAAAAPRIDVRQGIDV